jgi:hypothetical protein
MPDVTDSPVGVHPHVKVHLTDHPDGAIALWVKQRVHFMSSDEAVALAETLNAHVKLAHTRAAEVGVPARAVELVKPEPEVELTHEDSAY